MGNLNLKEMETKSLQELLNAILSELRKRESGGKKVLYRHECYGSSSYHFNKYKHYSKLVSRIDTSKTNGFAIGGEFINYRQEHLLPAGSYVYEFCSGEGGKLKLVKETGVEEVYAHRGRIQYNDILKISEIINN